ncbi:MAG: carboxypeptidase-like regulatory domain-containing protein [Tannerella sp.]|nr:carboxypeptidase-like regulatory domain-containing protein [Tannerella sp.]
MSKLMTSRNGFIPVLLCIFLAGIIHADCLAQQTGRITGTVTDVSGEPLAGVNIVVKGTTIGTITDSDGKYVLPPPPRGWRCPGGFLCGIHHKRSSCGKSDRNQFYPR